MRVRYGGPGRDQPISGFIRETEDGPVLDIDLNVYMEGRDPA